MKPDRLIVRSQAVLQRVSFCLCFQICSQLSISQSKDRKELGKQEDQNYVEKEEDPEVPYNICKHDHDRSQSGEYPQEKERFGYKKADNDAHEDPRRKVIGIIDYLNDAICNTSPDVDKIRKVVNV